jgi:hypothetical protein
MGMDRFMLIQMSPKLEERSTRLRTPARVILIPPTVSGLRPANFGNLGLILIELSLGGPKSSGEIVVIKGGVDDDVAVLGEVSRFDATWDRMPAV